METDITTGVVRSPGALAALMLDLIGVTAFIM